MLHTALDNRCPFGMVCLLRSDEISKKVEPPPRGPSSDAGKLMEVVSQDRYGPTRKTRPMCSLRPLRGSVRATVAGVEEEGGEELEGLRSRNWGSFFGDLG